MAALILPSRRVVQPQDIAAVDRSFSPQWIFVPQGKSIDLAGSKAVTYKGAATYGAAGSARFINLAAGQSVYSASAVSPGSDFILVVQYRNTSALSDCFLFCAKSIFNDGYGFYLSIKGANSLEISPGGNAYHNATITGIGAASTDVKTLVFHFRGTTLRIYSKGVLVSTVTMTLPAGAWTTGVALNGYTNTGSSSGSQAIGYSLAAVVRSGDPAALSLNPWQLFKPIERRIWAQVSAGGGGASQTVAFTLDGISAAVAQVAGRSQSLSASLDGVTFSASQAAGHSQTLAATLDGVSFSAAQSVGGANSQSLAVTLDGVQFAASQTLGHSQSLAAVLDDLTFSATQSAASPVKSQSLAVTLDDLQFYATQEGPAVAQGHGFVLVDFEPKLWWKRKPKALDEQEAAEKIASVARQIERVAVKHVKAGRVVQPVVSKPAKAEILQAIAPQLQQMPGFDPVELYRAILERLIQQEQHRQAEQQAQQIAAQEIERIRLMELDEDETIILLMGA